MPAAQLRALPLHDTNGYGQRHGLAALKNRPPREERLVAD